jgi:hypothetical protein
MKCHTQKMIALVTLCALGAMATTAWAQAGDSPQASPPAPDMKVTVTAATGKVEARKGPADKWVMVQSGDVLAKGSQLRTGLRSAITMNVGPNAEVTVRSLTIMMIDDLVVSSDAETLRTRLAMKYGTMKFDVRHIGFKNDFRVATPTGVMAVKGTGGWVITFDGKPMIMGVDTNGFESILKEFNDGKTSFLSGADQISGAFIDPVVYKEYKEAVAAAGDVKAEQDAVHGRLALTNLPAEEILDIKSKNDAIRETTGTIDYILHNTDGGENQFGDLE